MLCPYCKQEMEKGFIEQADIRIPLEWCTGVREEGIFQFRNHGKKLTSFKKPFIAVFHRTDCGKFIFDMPER